MSREKVLITSALPYANGPLHFGHIAGAYLPGDCHARYQRLKDKDVLYVCGSDEYGVAITLSAEIAGRSPQEHVDLFHGVIQSFFNRLNLSFDHYSRTTCSHHKHPAQQFFTELLENGYIEERTTDHLYSEEDEKFLADRYVEGTCPNCGFEAARGDECPKCAAAFEAIDLIQPRSKLTQAKLMRKPSKHWYLLLDKFRDQLMEHLESRQWKPNVTNFVKQYIKDLRPRAITRDSKWGIPVPLEGAEGKVLYVWFDAPIGYISSSQEWAEKEGAPEKWKEYWQDPKTKLVHFIGKDNIPFHAAIFPAMVLGQNQPFKLVDELPANEFYKLEGRQFSKSDGWYIDLDDFFERYTADQIRYSIAANAPESSDSEFTWMDFQMRCNGDLLGKYGNFANRTLVFAQKHCDGRIPEAGVLEEVDQEFIKNVRAAAEKVSQSYEEFSLRKASRYMMEVAALGNAYFDVKHPWKDVKAPETKERMATTIALCLECLKTLALVSFPVIPDAAHALWNLIGLSSSLNEERWDTVLEASLPVGRGLPPPQVLFKKVEDEQVQAELAKLHQLEAKTKKEQPAQAYAPLKEAVAIEEFRNLDFRVGEILDATRIPKSSKLYKLHVDLGMEKRIIVSGIRKHYKEADLIGKKVVVVANLKPARIMGVESQGMILAGSFDASLELLKIQELPPGSLVS